MHQDDLWGQRSFPTRLNLSYYTNVLYPDSGGTFTAQMGWSKGTHPRGNISVEVEGYHDDVMYSLLAAAWHGFTRTNAEDAVPKEVRRALRENDAYKQGRAVML